SPSQLQRRRTLHTATTAVCALSLHDALPISRTRWMSPASRRHSSKPSAPSSSTRAPAAASSRELRSPTPPLSSPRQCPLFSLSRSEEHTSELQSRENLVCRLLLEKKKKRKKN